jgi:P4 family phage/plasmid primase-like protien
MASTKYNSDLYQFLLQFKVDKGEAFTHTCIGRPAGSFNIPPERKDELVDLLHDTIFDKKIPFHLTEKPPQHTIIKGDLDFKYQLEENSRKYTLDHVRSIVDLYHKAIQHYLDVPEDQLKAFVFERKLPYKDRGNTKDGIHIMYPYIVADTKIQHLIREHVLIHCQPVLSQLGCKNNYDDIVDKSVISSNNWLFYGCSKPTSEPYKLTHIFDHEFNDLNIKKYTDKELIKLLSIRDHDESISIPIKGEHKYLLEKKKTTAAPAKRTIRITRLRNNDHMQPDFNLEEVRDLAKILSSDRADRYETWIEVGWCLRNINPSLLDSWISFSKKSPKYKEGECEELWTTMDYRDDGLGIGSLHRWAKLDNPKEYQNFTRNNIAKDILKSQSQTTQDVAKVVHSMYKYQFKCTSLKYNTWYEFRNHRWHPIDCGISLKKKIGNEVVNEYLRLITYYNTAAFEQQDEQKDQYLQKSKNLTDVTYKLRDYNFKEKIMKECQVMFYDQKFESLLDANPDLIGFENGVYDMRTGEFRDGRPEDYITLTTENDYIEFAEDDELIVAIFNFMSQVFPDPDVRDYVLVLLSSFLEGRNPNEKFHVWTGVGGNGKSKLLELFELAFGRYAGKIPVSILTQKRASSNAANPEVARLKGTRTVSTQEPEENERFNVGIMKDWTGGDRITCRPLYREPFDFKPQFKMVFCCNHLPALPPDDEGTWRRVSVIEFKSRFVSNPDPNNPYEFKRDTYLTEKLYAWKEAFMYVLVEHYKIYKKHGLIEPPAVKEATREYQKMNDIYIEFVDDCIEKDDTTNIKLEDTYKRFKDWWKENFSGKSPTRKDMKAALEKKLGKYLPSSKGGWRGYRLVYPGEDDDEENEIVINSGRINGELDEEEPEQ